jgi:hypothetical protein
VTLLILTTAIAAAHPVVALRDGSALRCLSAEVDGPLLRVVALDGQLLSLRVDLVDLSRSRLAAEAAPPPTTERLAVEAAAVALSRLRLEAAVERDVQVAAAAARWRRVPGGTLSSAGAPSPPRKSSPPTPPSLLPSAPATRVSGLARELRGLAERYRAADAALYAARDRLHRLLAEQRAAARHGTTTLAGDLLVLREVGDLQAEARRLEREAAVAEAAYERLRAEARRAGADAALWRVDVRGDARSGWGLPPPCPPCILCSRGGCPPES